MKTNIEEFLNEKKVKIELENVFRPIFYRLSIKEDYLMFCDLIQNDNRIVIFDEIYSQLKDLVKCLNPKIKFNDQVYDHYIKNHIGASNLNNYGVWVYYPWLNKVIHILNEKEFIEVRTCRNKYKINKEEQDLLAKKKVGIIGLSVGQSVSMTIALERSAGEIRIADFDTLELSNYNRLRTSLINLGVNKTISLAREIAEVDPYLTVVCFKEGINESNIDLFLNSNGKLDLLIDECDSVDIKILCRNRAKKFKIPVLMEASDKGTIDIERFDLESDRKILHGLIEGLDISNMNALTSEEKIPYILPIAGFETLSVRQKASLMEVGESITTWPQLASAVNLGGGITADTYRRIMTGELSVSGRFYVDLDEIIKDEIVSMSTKESVEIEEVETDFSLENEVESKFEGQKSLTKTQFNELIKVAIKSPSIGNLQPWKWIYRNDVVYLCNDKNKANTFCNENYLGSALSLGAAWETLRLACHKNGIELTTIYKANNNNETVLVKGYFSNYNKINNEMDLNIDQLYDFIDLRFTDRSHGNSQHVIEQESFDSLKNITESIEGAEFYHYDKPSEINEIAEICGRLDAIRLLNPKGQDDFFNKELRVTVEEAESTKTGLDIRLFDLKPSEIAGLRLAKDKNAIELLNKWGKGGSFGNITSNAFLHSTAIGLLVINPSIIQSSIDAGSAIQRMWLAAKSLSISIHPVTTPVLVFSTYMATPDRFSIKEQKEIEELYARYKKLFPILEDRKDVFLFRMFNETKKPLKSLRKDVEEVVLFTN